MKILRYGDTGSLVSLLQLGLQRAGFLRDEPDGIFGRKTKAALMRFQSSSGLPADGAAGPKTQRAMYPWYTGYTTHTVKRGDTLWSIARMHSTTVRAIETANPGLDPVNLTVGRTLTVPLPFDVVPENIPYSSALVTYCVAGLRARFPFMDTGGIGRSVMNAPLYYMKLGSGRRVVYYSAAHHANEWITTPVLLKYAQELAGAYAEGGSVYGRRASDILGEASIYITPMVDPDGVDLVTGALTGGVYFEAARRIAAAYPDIPFPSGWKANILGVDLNLQYPAEWEKAREIKFAQGFTGPAPRDYVGPAPLTAPESRAVYEFTKMLDPELILAYHTQGKTIYWKFLDFEPPYSRETAQAFGEASGYAVEETPYASGFAGLKDWFIQDYDRPGYTIECGLGENPLPLSQFGEIYRDNVGILTIGAEKP